MTLEQVYYHQAGVLLWGVLVLAPVIVGVGSLAVMGLVLLSRGTRAD